jgi:AcrR family transcriptional regulator
MRSDGEATRQRILVAAGAEFARFGLAGARVDRIATEANASKERLYAYFGDKRALFVAVLTAHMRDIMESMPIDPEDIPAFVGSIFDFAHAHPEHFRMMEWARLSGDLELLPEVPADIMERDARVIRVAQERGLVDPEWNAGELFTMLFALATSWLRLAERMDASAEATARHREATVRAARKLIAP